MAYNKHSRRITTNVAFFLVYMEVVNERAEFRNLAKVLPKYARQNVNLWCLLHTAFNNSRKSWLIWKRANINMQSFAYRCMVAVKMNGTN